MSDNLTTGLVTIAMGIIGVATVAVIFSQKANTAPVVNAAGNAFSTSILAAVSPVTGSAPSTSSSL
jgi:PRD1 phage membrane DNA delivery